MDAVSGLREARRGGRSMRNVFGNCSDDTLLKQLQKVRLACIIATPSRGKFAHEKTGYMSLTWNDGNKLQKRKLAKSSQAMKNTIKENTCIMHTQILQGRAKILLASKRAFKGLLQTRSSCLRTVYNRIRLHWKLLTARRGKGESRSWFRVTATRSSSYRLMQNFHNSPS